jgi:hypothetical protein
VREVMVADLKAVDASGERIHGSIDQLQSMPIYCTRVQDQDGSRA